MSQFAAITFIVVFLLVITDITVKSLTTKELSDRIFSVIDDLFICLKINTKMINPDNVQDYMAMHNFVQDVLYKNQGRYEEISNNIKTAINNKTVNQISGVNEVIDEMIREEAVNNISSIRNDTKPSNTNATFKGFVDLVKLLNIKTEALIPNDFTSWSSNASQEVQGRRIFAGSRTGIARYPFMVSVHVAGLFVCAGTLLHESLVLSAASCLMRCVHIMFMVSEHVAGYFVCAGTLLHESLLLSAASCLMRRAQIAFMVSEHVVGRFVCAGTLLHESLVLSAASCLMRVRDDPDLPVMIRIGSDYVTKMGNLVTIDRIIFHPDFDPSTLAHNLVLLKTKKSLRFIQRKVVAIKYDKWDFLLKDANNIVILGWGRRGPADKSTDDQPLSRARLNLYDLEECKYIYSKDYVTDKTFCAGFVDRGEGACNHDGGGPALVGSLLTGVISFGSPRCGRVDAPTVFTRLGLYSDWIDSMLDSVTISKGKLANTPQNFEVSRSFEVGLGTKEIDAEISEKLAPENPRDILEREFGIKEILDGPIDTSKGEKLQYNTTAKLELGSEVRDTKKSEPGNLEDMSEREYDVTDILNGPIDIKGSLKPNELDTVRNTTSLPLDKDDTNTSEQDQNKDADELQSNIDQIILSDDSEELTTLSPADNSLPSLENEQAKNKPSEAFADLMKQLYEDEKDSIEPKVQKDSEETTIAYVDVDPENEPSTASRVKSTDELEALRMGNQVTDEDVPIMGKFRFKIDTKSTESKENLKSTETPQFDVQYQVEIKQIVVPKSERQNEKNNSLIILSDSGTTQRIEVKNAELLTNKLKTAMKAIVKHMKFISDKERLRK